MVRHWLTPLRQYLVWSCAALLAATGATRAGDDTAELRALLQQQQQQIEELKKQIENRLRPAVSPDGAPLPAVIEEESVRRIVAGYLKDNPGAGMPPSVQTGYATATGFAIRSVNNPTYVKWEDDLGKIPFELRIKGRIQVPYIFYKVTDNRNHLTGNLANPATGDLSAPDFSALEVTRGRLIFEGSLFTPDLRYQIHLDGNTRGIAAFDPRQNALANPIGNVQGGQAVGNTDHAVRLYGASVAYDWHPCSSQPGCGPDCCEGTYRYVPTVTFTIGKMIPMLGLEEYLTPWNQQFVEYSMADWFFDADDNNWLMAAGVQAKLLEDRLYLLALVTNGNETQTPALQMDRLPGFNLGGWYDFGGTWNEAQKRWDLYGDCISDIDYSCCPVARVGGAVNLVPMDRRSLYTQAELDRVRVVPGIPNAGGQLDGVLNGAGVATGTLGAGTGISPFAVDAFDSYTFDVFAAAKYKGFSLYNEWWLRDVDNFRGERIPGTGLNRSILYSANNPGSNSGIPALFPANTALIDYGTTVQAGYFLIPKKLEVAARYSWICGQSGNINGNGTFTTIPAAAVGVPAGGGNPTTIRVVNGAFSHFQEAEEIAIGLNYFFHRHLCKWQTDLSFYRGGNPAANGQSVAGFIPGADGYMIRTQIQLGF
jgi:hypothetical protein